LVGCAVYVHYTTDIRQGALQFNCVMHFGEVCMRVMLVFYKLVIMRCVFVR